MSTEISKEKIANNNNVFCCIEDLLESILSKEACKVGLPNLEQLTGHRFWQEYVPKFYEQYMSGWMENNKALLKLSTVAKEQIKIAIQKSEQRLRDEQKSVSSRLMMDNRFSKKSN